MISLLEDLRWRGLVHQMTDDVTLPRRLEAGAMTLYIGFDPTADSLHVGHLQQLCLLQRFHQAGHHPIALVGGGTGMIGDPSGKSEERNLLDSEQLDTNRERIHRQIATVLEPAGDGFILADNREWLGAALLLEFLRDVGKHFTVNQMIRKDSVRNRLEGREQSLSFTEFSYMLLQAWDFVQLNERFGCDLQLGGSDQWGNITEGVDLIRRLRGAQAYGLTSPLVTKADGTKFGKTEEGNVWLDPQRTSPYAFFQFWLRTPDVDTAGFLRRFTFLTREEITSLDAASVERPGKREAQRALARAVTALVHGDEETARAERAAAVLFTSDITNLDEATLAGALVDAPSTVIAKADLDAGSDIAKALQATGLASSGGDARRILAAGSISVNGNRITDDYRLTMQDALHGKWIVLRKGPRTQHVLTIQA